ncbi:hypothetical protein BO78DRAFT_386068 [Aspergillus sclerotiicarbonarius CBS 121057]|uniref:Uncharacterized protein n=1 Tax=Aspergillus sclerotiicarbonarius (strain CBS 121057 / IBT 28362) TaxID=1448318 RepID=A0A319ECP6_ASPSB|nr:hypothetical protein BO78DRAFT_386068 [Aspergillus sclerotiicarbonarius CBS 121057]
MVDLKFEVETWVELSLRAEQDFQDPLTTDKGFLKFVQYLNPKNGGPCDLKPYSNWRETMRSFWEKMNHVCNFNFDILPKIEVTIMPLESGWDTSSYKSQGHAVMHFYKVIKEMAGPNLDSSYLNWKAGIDVHEELDNACNTEKDVCEYLVDRRNGGFTWEYGGTAGRSSDEGQPLAILLSPEEMTYDQITLWVEFVVGFTQASLGVDTARLLEYPRDMAGLQRFITENVPGVELDLSRIAYEIPESRSGSDQGLESETDQLVSQTETCLTLD